MSRTANIILALALTTLTMVACDPEPDTAVDAGTSFRDGPPIPAGKVSAKVSDVHWASKLLYGCLPQEEPHAAVSLIVTNEADGDDVQYIIYTVEVGLHEDSVACIYDTIVDWAEQG